MGFVDELGQSVSVAYFGVVALADKSGAFHARKLSHEVRAVPEVRLVLVPVFFGRLSFLRFDMVGPLVRSLIVSVRSLSDVGVAFMNSIRVLDVGPDGLAMFS